MQMPRTGLKLFTCICLWALPALLPAQNRYDVVISELLPDPTPQVGLPNAEFVEIKNTTAAPIVLTGWRIADATGQSGPLPAYTLKPDSFLIICTASAVPLFAPFGPTVSVTGFPSLDNDDDVISLRSNTGRTIHAIAYTTAWYQNPVKTDGGWSLEMVDGRNPCGGIDNWRASTDTRGGTPGLKNSVDATNADSKAPQLQRSFTNSATQIVALFNEPVDSTSAAVAANYQINNGLSIIAAQPQAPLFQQVVLTLSVPLTAGTVYTVTVRNVTDCKGNAIGSFNTARSGLPVDADSMDLVVNEILFNPKPNGFDFLELYNRSNKIFDANKLSIANRSSTGAIANIKKMSETPCLVFPGDYVTLTENANYTQRTFLVKNPDWLIELPSLPSMNDDEGNPIILNFQGRIVDQVVYKDDWHFKLIDNEEGISIERIDYNQPSQNPDNWHSASFSSGFGTPTAQNSQFKTGNTGPDPITLSNKTFSPDNDGLDDVLGVSYDLPERGYLANITIYDAAGRPVRQLKRNELLGFKGVWTWDGLDDKGAKLSTGIYILVTEIFNLTGTKRTYKNNVVLARRLK
jgi:hypothetical protein